MMSESLALPEMSNAVLQMTLAWMKSNAEMDPSPLIRAHAACREHHMHESLLIDGRTLWAMRSTAASKLSPWHRTHTQLGRPNTSWLGPKHTLSYWRMMAAGDTSSRCSWAAALDAATVIAHLRRQNKSLPDNAQCDCNPAAAPLLALVPAQQIGGWSALAPWCGLHHRDGKQIAAFALDHNNTPSLHHQSVPGRCRPIQTRHHRQMQEAITRNRII